MNAEISKIRKIRNNGEIFNHAPKRVEEKRISEAIYELNTNFNALYDLQRRSSFDIEEYANKFTENIYIVLNIFNEMGIYPDYFYDQVIKMNVEYRKLVDSNNTLRGNYRLYNEVGLSSKLSKSIKKGIDNGYYRVQAYPKKDINDAFLELTGFFEAFNIPHNIKSREQFNKTLNDISFNTFNIVQRLYNSDDIYDDIEYLSRLLFEYVSFFVAMGIHPKEYLDDFINTVEGTKIK